MSKSRWSWAAAVALLIGSSGLSGCSGGGSGSGAAPAEPGAGRDSLVIAAQADAKDMLYLVSQSASDAAIIEALQMAPMDADFDCKVTYKPALASSWEFGADGKSITIHLRDDITWQDGTPVTADDYKFTYDLVWDPIVASPRRDQVQYMMPDARPAVIDAHTVRFDFDHEYDHVTMLAHANMPLAPKHILDSPSVDRAALRSHPVDATSPLASGPWQVDKWEKGQSLVLVPNEHFNGPKQYRPKLRRVIFRVIPEYATRLLELENGSVDVMDQVLVSDADRLRQEHPEITLRRRGWRSMDYLAWNSLDAADYKAKKAAAGDGKTPDFSTVKPHPIFGDKEVRKALAKAVDVDKLIKDLLTSQVTGDVYGRAAVGTITPALCGAHNDAIKPIGYDPTGAVTRLGELGWKDTNGDGWLDKEGQVMRFTVLVNSGNARRAKAAEIIQDGMKKVGVDMQIDQLETNTFFERLRNKDYEAALAGWSAGLFIDPSSFWGRESQFNFTSYENPRAAALITAGLAEPDYEKAKPIWQELQQVIYDDQPYAFLYWMDEIVAVHSRFQNTTVDILAPYRNLYEWSVPVDKVKYPN
jgi:peptide/nickel transport system substrate-binding protein